MSTKQINIDPNLLISGKKKKEAKKTRNKTEKTGLDSRKLKSDQLKHMRKMFISRHTREKKAAATAAAAASTGLGPLKSNRNVPTPINVPLSPNLFDEPDNEFSKSLQFLKNYSEKNEIQNEKNKINRKTVKSNPSMIPQIEELTELEVLPNHLKPSPSQPPLTLTTNLATSEDDNVEDEDWAGDENTKRNTLMNEKSTYNNTLMNEKSTYNNTLPVSSTSTSGNDLPWGSMKNGIKPTYRNWKSSTQKLIQPSRTRTVEHIPFKGNPTRKHTRRVKKKTTKTTMVRKHAIGLSRKTRKVSILIKSKNVRNKVISAKAELKRIRPVDRDDYLKKHGLSKVGTKSPNNVKQAIYEAALLSGEIRNINKENLIYNFIQGEGDNKVPVVIH
jgi:hypothetical protein